MNIISHRGLWQTPNEKNTAKAFAASFNLGFGSELDVRDCKGRLLVSHNPPSGNELEFAELLQIMNGRNLPLAINIKADGLINDILSILGKFGHTNYFTFDMSIPDLVVQYSTTANCYCGISDIVPEPPKFKKYNGIWLDSFLSDWFNTETLDNIIAKYSHVCVVSSDLHNRQVEKQWETISKSKYLYSNNLSLCTDNPVKAKSYFGL